jgi:chromosome segregation ATPase
MKNILITLALVAINFGAVTQADAGRFRQARVARRIEHRVERRVARKEHRAECPRVEQRCERADKRATRQGNRRFDFAGSFGSQRQLTESLQGSIRDLTEANRLAGADRERLMDRLAENMRERKMFEKELAGFRAERSGLMEQIRTNRKERLEATRQARAERAKDRETMRTRWAESRADGKRLFTQFTPLKTMVNRLTALVWAVLVLLGSIALVALLGSYLWKRAKNKVGM